MPLYFAYGANMDRDAMQMRCPKSRPLGRARLAGHRFVIMGSGYASVKRDPQRSVHGVLYDLAFADIPALDRYEDTGRGLYRKITQPVLRETGGPARAMVYVGTSAQEGSPQGDYLDRVIAAARAWELPENYIASLQALTGAVQQVIPGRRAIKLQGI
jgi:gamma-glutamylcyclotransferase (GGCT)/AIG2-like uncharacterized protein YtfP